MSAISKIKDMIASMDLRDVFNTETFLSTNIRYSRVRDILGSLEKKGLITRIHRGTYVAKKRPQVFGMEVPVSGERVLKALLLESRDKRLIGGLSLFLKYGLTTQNPVVITILNNKSTYKKTIKDDHMGVPVRVEFKKIAAPITRVSKPLIEILEIIKHHESTTGADVWAISNWLTKRIPTLKPGSLRTLFNLATNYYPLYVGEIILLALEAKPSKCLMNIPIAHEDHRIAINPRHSTWKETSLEKRLKEILQQAQTHTEIETEVDENNQS